MSPINIVINALSAKGGGGQTYLTNILRHLDEHSGMKVWIMAPDSLDIPKKTNIERIHVKWPTDNPYLRLFWERCWLPRVLKNLHADVLYCPGGFIHTNVPRGCKRVVTFQNLMAFDSSERARYSNVLLRFKYWLFKRLFLANMSKADLVIFISEYSKQIVEANMKRRIARSVVVPHGLSDEFRANLETQSQNHECMPADEYLLYVSSIRAAYKNHLELVRGYALLKQRRATKEKLVFIGGCDGEYADSVRREIAKLGLEDGVLLLGQLPHSELPTVYENAKINIFASSCETCSNIVLEAMGASRPVLMSNKQPMPEFAGGAAVYFDPLDPEDFAGRMLAIIDDERRLNELSKVAYEHSKNYDWNKTAKMTWGAIESLCKT